MNLINECVYFLMVFDVVTACCSLSFLLNFPPGTTKNHKLTHTHAQSHSSRVVLYKIWYKYIWFYWMQSEKAATFRSESLNALYNLIYSADTQQCNNCWCVIVLFKHLFYAIIISHCVLFWGGRSEEMIHIKKLCVFALRRCCLCSAIFRCALPAHIMIYILFTVWIWVTGLKQCLTGHCGSCLSHFFTGTRGNRVFYDLWKSFEEIKSTKWLSFRFTTGSSHHVSRRAHTNGKKSIVHSHRAKASLYALWGWQFNEIKANRKSFSVVLACVYTFIHSFCVYFLI